jgi:hypothetical protein
MNDELSKKFISFRTGDIVMSSGEGIGDLVIFFGRHTTIQHSAILVWLDKKSLETYDVKIHPAYIDEDTTVLSFLGLSEKSRVDMVSQSRQKGLILWQPEDLFANAPIVYVRALNPEHISDEYVTRKMTEYINIHHLRMQYAYGKMHIVTVGLGFDVLGEHPTQGKLCSENIYIFLKHLCNYPEFVIDGKKVKHDDYKVIDAIERMYVPDFFFSDNNTHPVFLADEARVISKKNEEDVTVNHPYFLIFVIVVILIIFIFLLVNNYCETCDSGVCRPQLCFPGQKDIFDLF